jgi:vacuolar-type H+-ATPase subunit E/Vma4
MALADILQAMDDAAAAQIARIEDETDQSVARILGAAEDDAAAIRARHLGEAQLPIQRERARRLNRARLAALGEVSQARERLFAEALERARERLAGLRADPAYPAILGALAREARSQLGGDAVLRADPRDEPILRAAFPDARITFDLEVWGGVEASAPDRRIVVINTLEARLEQARDALRGVVIPLFEDRPEPWATMTMPTHDFAR